MGHNLFLTVQPFALQHQAYGIFLWGGNDPLLYRKAGNKVAPSQEWSGAGSTSLMLTDDQLASVCRWGESCCPCLPKGQRKTHVPVSR